MNQIERISRLYKLVEVVGGKIQTRKKLHKLAYLMQFSGEDLDQDFIFHNFGVFSPSLANDLGIATRDPVKVLEEKRVEDSRYDITLAPDLDKDMNWLIDVTFSSESIALAKALAQEEPRLLETLSTIVYLSDNYYSGDELKAKLTSLKPKLTSYYSDAFELAEKYFGISV